MEVHKILAAVLAASLPLACGATSDSHDTTGGAGQSGHESAGRGGTGTSGGSGGGAGTALGGSTAGGVTGGGSGGRAGGAGDSGSSAGGRAGGGRAGTSGAGSGGRGGAGAGGSAGADAGEGGGGTSGTAGASGGGGMDGKPCGARTGATCDPGQYCRFESGTCGSTDETGSCTTQPGGIACVQGYACGCDGKVYINLCQARASGVDTWSGNQCVPGDGKVGDGCLTDDDCSGSLKCCSSPIQVISCTTPMGGGCPLTP